jgi:hypothetical protein
MRPWSAGADVKGATMMSKVDVRKTVFAFYRTKKPDCTRETQFRRDMGLNDMKIEKYNTDLAIKCGSNATRSKLVACKSIGDLIDLIIDTRISKYGVLYEAANA